MSKLARLCALAHADAYVGTVEQPPGSNRGPLIDKWNLAANGITGEPWCMSFVHGMFAECGVTLGGWAGVQTFERWAAVHGYEVTRPLQGDLVCLDWNADRWYDHVEFVAKVIGTGPGQRPPYIMRTIGGNVSDAVRRKVRVCTSRNARFVRVPG
jgi:hypothetical protein